METNETTITIERNKSFVGCALRIRVCLDGKEVAKLGIGQKKQITIPNGEHTINADGNVVVFNAAGEAFFFLMEPQQGAWPVIFDIKQPGSEPPEVIPVGWSKGKPNLTSAVFGAIVFFVAYIVAGMALNIKLIPGVGVVFTFLGAFVGYRLGAFIPIYNIGRKKTNLALSLFIALVMMVGFMYSLALLEVFPFMPKANQLFDGHIALLIAWLAISFCLSFVAVRNRIKALLIVLSIIVAISYTNFILVLSTGKSIITVLGG